MRCRRAAAALPLQAGATLPPAHSPQVPTTRCNQGEGQKSPCTHSHAAAREPQRSGAHNLEAMQLAPQPAPAAVLPRNALPCHAGGRHISTCPSPCTRPSPVQPACALPLASALPLPMHPKAQLNMCSGGDGRQPLRSAGPCPRTRPLSPASPVQQVPGCDGRQPQQRHELPTLHLHCPVDGSPVGERTGEVREHQLPQQVPAWGLGIRYQGWGAQLANRGVGCVGTRSRSRRQ